MPASSIDAIHHVPRDAGGPAAIACDFFGPDARFHHVGLAVRSIRALSPSAEILVEPAQRVRLTFIELGGVRIELLEPCAKDSPIARSMRDGVKLLHLCFEVPDLDAALARCRPAGFHRLGAPAPARTFDNRRVAWVFSREYGLVELAEAPSG